MGSWSLGDQDPSGASAFGDSFLSKAGFRDVFVDLRQVQNTLTLPPFCLQIWTAQSSRGPCRQKGNWLDPQKHPPRPGATSQKGDLRQEERVNLVSTTLLSSGTAALGLYFCMDFTG